MSSSSSSSLAGVLAGAELVVVVSATPGGPYWPRGFFTPGRLKGENLCWPGRWPRHRCRQLIRVPTCSSGCCRTWCGCTSAGHGTGLQKEEWGWPQTQPHQLEMGRSYKGGGHVTIRPLPTVNAHLLANPDPFVDLLRHNNNRIIPVTTFILLNYGAHLMTRTLTNEL